jgi:hypothetical protein
MCIETADSHTGASSELGMKIQPQGLSVSRVTHSYLKAELTGGLISGESEYSRKKPECNFKMLQWT